MKRMMAAVLAATACAAITSAQAQDTEASAPSLSLDEALAIWDRQEVLGDVVRVIRTFRPDVIVTRFAPERQPGNHGHHNASAVLAVEAFKIAGDPTAYPEQIAEGLRPWQPTRIVQNGGGTDLSLQISGTAPITGETFQAIAQVAMKPSVTGYVNGAIHDFVFYRLVKKS